MFKNSFIQPSAGSISKTPDLSRLYDRLVAESGFRHDPAQLKVIDYLQNLLDQVILLDKRQRRGFAGKFTGKTTIVSCRHLYIYGDVGHGKSMLMDLFYSTCPVKQKRRVHFHAFMQEVHAFIHHWKKNRRGDQIPALAREIKAKTKLLCFDEFHVTDIADAMIMERLFRLLFEQGVIVVMTSNRHPTDLYRGGLLREQFLPFVDLLLKSADVIELSGHVDYRFMQREAEERRYHFPLNETAGEFVRQKFFQHARARDLVPGLIEVFGRHISLGAVHGRVVLTTFAELCKRPLGAADYLHIAQRFDTVIMADIPRLAPDSCDEARRFEILIDALYEHRVKFICSAEAHPREIYKEGEGAFEFKRTVSRLMEMQAESYHL